MLTSAGPWCCCGCPYFTEEFGGGASTETLVALKEGKWDVVAGDWLATYVNNLSGTNNGYMQTSDEDALVVCRGLAKVPSVKKLIHFQIRDYAIGNEWRIYFAYTDVDNWARLQIGLIQATVDSAKCGACQFYEFKVVVCTAGTEDQIGDTTYILAGVAFGTTPSYIDWILSWDGTFLTVYRNGYSSSGVFPLTQSVVQEGYFNYSFYVPGAPTDGYYAAFGSGAIGHATITRVRFHGRVVLFSHDSDIDGCWFIERGCSACDDGQYPESWDGEFLDVANGTCTDCDSIFDGVTFNLHKKLVLTSADGHPDPVYERYQQADGGNCRHDFNWGTRAFPPYTTPVCASSGALYNIYCIVYYYPPTYNHVGQPSPVDPSFLGKWQIRAFMDIEAGLSFGAGPHWQTGPIDNLDCSGATTYNLPYNGLVGGGTWTGCDFSASSLDLTPVGGSI